MRKDPGDRAELDFSGRWKNLFSKPNKSSVLRYFNDPTAPLLSTRNLSSLTVKCRGRVLVEPTTRNLLLSEVLSDSNHNRRVSICARWATCSRPILVVGDLDALRKCRSFSSTCFSTWNHQPTACTGISQTRCTLQKAEWKENERHSARTAVKLFPRGSTHLS